MLHTPGKVRERPAGQTLVEFAMILPLLLLLVLGIMDFGRLVFAYASVANAAREGSRYGIVNPGWVTAADNPDPDNITYRARDKVYVLDRNDLAISVGYPDDPPSNLQVGDRIIVTATIPYEMMTPIMSQIYHGAVPASERQIRFVSMRSVMRESGVVPVTPEPTLPPTNTPTATPTATETPAGPTSTPTETPSGPTPTPTLTPTPVSTDTPTPTSTPTPVLALTVTFEPGYPVKKNGANKPIFVKVKVVDQAGASVNDTVVTFTAGSTNGTLTYIAGSSGLYGSGANCWSGGSFGSNVTVSVTAAKAGYTSGNVAQMTVDGGSSCP